jgi:hypothetical protein
VILSRSFPLIFSDLSCLLLPLYDLRVVDHGQAQTGQSQALTDKSRAFAKAGKNLYPEGIWPWWVKPSQDLTPWQGEDFPVWPRASLGHIPDWSGRAMV